MARGHEYYPPSRPRPAKGGIRSQSRRGGGENWWAARWLAVLDGLDLGGRLTRGRSYARRGQVLSISVEQGVVTAAVQGSRRRPYRTAIWVRSLAAGEKERVAHALAERPAFAAQLLAGRMPEEMEDVFREAGCSLFPQASEDLRTECSCPDPSNPCKHVAAVYVLLGEEFARDPLLIFRLRGVEREEIVPGGTALTAKGDRAANDPSAADPAEDPLPEDPAVFWSGGTSAAADAVAEAAPDRDPQLPPAGAALPRRLGHFPFWRGREPLLPALEQIYRRAAAEALEIAAGDAGPGRPPSGGATGGPAEREPGGGTA